MLVELSEMNFSYNRNTPLQIALKRYSSKGDCKEHVFYNIEKLTALQSMQQEEPGLMSTLPSHIKHTFNDN